MDDDAMTDGAAMRFEPGRNCWRVARAERLTPIVDAADYFAALREAMAGARRQLLLVGWDFDFDIEMLPGESDAEGRALDGLPNKLGPFLEAVVERAPGLEVHILKWNGALLVAPSRLLPMIKVAVFGSERIHFALDSHHPLGACHHQKIVVIDDGLAFCGGIDVTEERWDTPEHRPRDPRRVRADGSLTGPWHDVTTALTGPVARALGDLARERWARATGDALEPPRDAGPPRWPAGLGIVAEDVDVAVARTAPPFDGRPLVDEVERLYLDQIAAARRLIYVESQYFVASAVIAALERRLREPGGPEIVVVNPQSALGVLEDRAMHVLRGRVIERLRAADRTGRRFRIYHPADAEGAPIYVHAKVFVVDDRILRVGSSNLDDRSMGFDTECDLAVAPEGGAAAFVRDVRRRLVAEHLGVAPDALGHAEREAGSLVGAIEALNAARGRGLRPIRRMPEGPVGRWLADTRLLDPRFRRGQAAHAGRGLRPRHAALLGAAAGLGLLGWMLWRRRRRR